MRGEYSTGYSCSVCVSWFIRASICWAKSESRISRRWWPSSSAADGAAFLNEKFSAKLPFENPRQTLRFSGSSAENCRLASRLWSFDCRLKLTAFIGATFTIKWLDEFWSLKWLVKMVESLDWNDQISTRRLRSVPRFCEGRNGRFLRDPQRCELCASLLGGARSILKSLIAC